MLQSKLALLAADPRNIGRLCNMIGNIPNIDFPTMGGTVFWDTLASLNGRKLQKKMFTNHCRIIDPGNVRRAWGSESAMLDALNRLQPVEPAGSKSTSDATTHVFCSSCGTKVPEGNYCKHCGAEMH
jgi:hypothetical protein